MTKMDFIYKVRDIAASFLCNVNEIKALERVYFFYEPSKVDGVYGQTQIYFNQYPLCFAIFLACNNITHNMHLAFAVIHELGHVLNAARHGRACDNMEHGPRWIKACSDMGLIVTQDDELSDATNPARYHPNLWRELNKLINTMENTYAPHNLHTFTL